MGGVADSAAAHVIGPSSSLGVLLGAAAVGDAAVLLPWIVRGRSAVLDVVAATVWSAALLLAARPARRGLSGARRARDPRGAVLGRVLGGALAVAARALRGPV